MRQAVSLFFFLQPGAHGGIGFGQVVQAFGQRVEIHHRAADNQRQPAARADFLRQLHAIADKLRRAVRLRRRDDVDKVVRHGIKLGSGRFCRADVHIAVHQRGIEADDFDRQGFGDFQGKGGFPAGSRAEDGKGFWGVHIKRGLGKRTDYSKRSSEIIASFMINICIDTRFPSIFLKLQQDRNIDLP